MKATTIPKAQPVEGEELQKLLDEEGVKSIDEIPAGTDVIRGEDFDSWDEMIAEFKRRSIAESDNGQ